MSRIVDTIRFFTFITYGNVLCSGRSSAVYSKGRGGVRMNKLSTLDWVAVVLLIVGGLNWALVGLFKVDLVALIFGNLSALSRIVYVLVGASAVYVAVVSPKLRKE